MLAAATDLVGHTAIVTGSTRGIGLAIAQMFAESGASVVVSSEDASDVAETDGQCRIGGTETGSD